MRTQLSRKCNYGAVLPGGNRIDSERRCPEPLSILFRSARKPTENEAWGSFCSFWHVRQSTFLHFIPISSLNFTQYLFNVLKGVKNGGGASLAVYLSYLARCRTIPPNHSPSNPIKSSPHLLIMVRPPSIPSLTSYLSTPPPPPPPPHTDTTIPTS